MKKFRTKMLALLFGLVVALGVLPATALAADPIGSVTLEGAAGSAPVDLTVPADAPYTIAVQGWAEVDDEGIPVSDEFATQFEAGKRYIFLLALQPKAGESFAADAKLAVTGIPWYSNASRFIDDEENPYFGCLALEAVYVVPDSIVPNENAIGSVTFAGTAPAAGSAPVDLTVPADAPYTIAVQAWLELKETGVPVSEEPATQFEAGKNYIFLIALQANGGYYFTPEATISVTGIDWFSEFSGIIEDPDNPFAGCLALEAVYMVPPAEEGEGEGEGEQVDPGEGEGEGEGEQVDPGEGEGNEDGEEGDEGNEDEPTIPATADGNTLGLWMAIVLASLGVFFGVSALRKKSAYAARHTK